MKFFSSYHSFVILRLFLSDNKFQFHRLMYERKIPVDLDCPLRLTINLIDSKWKSCILDELRNKTIYPELPPRSEYTITSLGLTLIPIIDAMIEWGNKNENLFIRKYGKAISNDITEN